MTMSIGAFSVIVFQLLETCEIIKHPLHRASDYEYHVVITTSPGISELQSYSIQDKSQNRDSPEFASIWEIPLIPRYKQEITVMTFTTEQSIVRSRR